MNEIVDVPEKEVDLTQERPYFFDENGFIQEHLQLLVELHGAYNASDERDVKRMAGFARSFGWCDYQLSNPFNHVIQTKSNGAQPSPWFAMRERCNVQILHIKKDLGMDLRSRNPVTTGQQAEESLFKMGIKDEKEFAHR